MIWFLISFQCRAVGCCGCCQSVFDWSAVVSVLLAALDCSTRGCWDGVLGTSDTDTHPHNDKGQFDKIKGPEPPAVRTDFSKWVFGGKRLTVERIIRFSSVECDSLTQWFLFLWSSKSVSVFRWDVLQCCMQLPAAWRHRCCSQLSSLMRSSTLIVDFPQHEGRS